MFTSLFLTVPLLFAAEQVEFCGFLQLSFSEIAAMRALRVNQNSKVVGRTDKQ